MQIQNASFQFSHTRTYSEEYKQTESFYTRGPNGERSALTEAQSEALTQGSQQLDVITELSVQGQALAASITNNEQSTVEVDAELSNMDAKTFQLKLMVEYFTGREMEFSTFELQQTPDNANGGQAAPAQQAEVIYEFKESYFEQESSLFTAVGSFTLASGEVVDIDFAQYAQRQFYVENSLALQVGEVELQDPLVINLGGAGLSLTDEKVSFDLDSDGNQETINFATGSSGFLALDKNGNGKIDNGSELFGATSGDGFAELAVYDEDGNGFIDSADSVFSQLQFYQKDAASREVVKGVSELGIGAFFLGNTATPYQIKDEDNQLQAVVRNSGLYINTDLTTGALQQIDLAV